MRYVRSGSKTEMQLPPAVPKPGSSFCSCMCMAPSCVHQESHQNCCPNYGLLSGKVDNCDRYTLPELLPKVRIASVPWWQGVQLRSDASLSQEHTVPRFTGSTAGEAVQLETAAHEGMPRGWQQKFGSTALRESPQFWGWSTEGEKFPWSEISFRFWKAVNSLGKLQLFWGNRQKKKITLTIKNYRVRKKQIISSEEILMKGHLLERGKNWDQNHDHNKTQSMVVLFNGKLLTDHKGKQPENSAFQRPSCDFDFRV